MPLSHVNVTPTLRSSSTRLDVWCMSVARMATAWSGSGRTGREYGAARFLPFRRRRRYGSGVGSEPGDEDEVDTCSARTQLHSLQTIESSPIESDQIRPETHPGPGPCTLQHPTAYSDQFQSGQRSQHTDHPTPTQECHIPLAATPAEPKGDITRTSKPYSSWTTMNGQRQQSPALAPPLPPKDSSTRSSRYLDVDVDLAEAVRNSVQIGDSAPNSNNTKPKPGSNGGHYQHPSIDFSAPSGILQLPQLQTGVSPPSEYQYTTSRSLNPLVPRRTPSPNDNHLNRHTLYNPPTQDNMQSAHQQQPQLPSQRIISSQNPFEQDEMEPPAGPVRPPGSQRQKVVRSQTAQSG